MRHVPGAELAHRHAMHHREFGHADKTLPTGPQGQAIDRTSGRIRTIQNPDRFAMLRRRLDDVEQGRGIGIDPAT